MLGGSADFSFKAGAAEADVPNPTGVAEAKVTCVNTVAGGVTGKLTVH